MRKNIYTKLILTGIGALSCVAGAAWLASSRMESSTDHRLSVSATFYPIAFLAEQIGGDRVSVRTVVPPGIEPHDFDPSLRDIAGIYASKLFLVGGAGVDRFAERLEDDLSRKGVRVVILSDSVDLLSAAEDEAGQPVPIGTRDPHFWLDPAEYEKGASAVMRALVDADPAHASVYRTNFDRLKENLDELDMRFRTISTSACRQDTVVVSHNAFSYLARRYGFTVRSLVGIDPSQEVSVGTLSDVIRFMQEKQIRYVLGEPFGNAGVVQTVGREVPAEVLILNPIEGLSQSDVDSGKNYFTAMDENWITLRKALECEERK